MRFMANAGTGSSSDRDWGVLCGLRVGWVTGHSIWAEANLREQVSLFPPLWFSSMVLAVCL